VPGWQTLVIETGTVPLIVEFFAGDVIVTVQGSPLAVGVGARVGAIVGAMVGARVGAKVGVGVSAGVSERVGLRIGEAVRVGEALGAGEPVVVRVGEGVGRVGHAGGTTVGEAVRLGVGEGVGASVESGVGVATPLATVMVVFEETPSLMGPVELFHATALIPCIPFGTVLVSQL
jgi:hypothetical protein